MAITSRPIPGSGTSCASPTDDVDALEFQRLVLAADEAGAEQRTEDEIGHLRHALRLLIGSGVACSAVGGIADLMTDLLHDGASGCGPGSRFIAQAPPAVDRIGEGGEWISRRFS